MGTFTSPDNLYKPTVGEDGWGTLVNTNFDTIQALVTALAANLGKPLALTGATAATRFVGGTATGAPTSGTFVVGDFVIDRTGKVWINTVAGSPGTWTQVSSNLAAPIDAQYLVTVADANLTNEIVVGATPGGELGGTWASPTVDATHSGSAHLALGTTPSTQAFGDAAAGGSATTASKNDHKHAMPADPKGLPLSLTGATQTTRFVGGTASGAPSSGTFAIGDFAVDRTGKIWVCTAAGTPGTWTNVDAGGGSSITYGTTADIQDIADTEGAGSSTAVARADHVHAHPAGLLPDKHHNQNHGAGDHDNVTRQIWRDVSTMNIVGPSTTGSFGSAPDYVRTIDFDSATTEYTRFGVYVPNDWITGMNITLMWLPQTPGGGAEAVMWEVHYKFMAAGDIASAAGTTVTLTTPSVIRSAGAIQKETPLTIATGAAADSLLKIIIKRDGAGGADTLTGDAGLLGALLEYTANQ